jgi:hypothetical protein
MLVITHTQMDHCPRCGPDPPHARPGAVVEYVTEGAPTGQFLCFQHLRAFLEGLHDAIALDPALAVRMKTDLLRHRGKLASGEGGELAVLVALAAERVVHDAIHGLTDGLVDVLEANVAAAGLTSRPPQPVERNGRTGPSRNGAT